MKKRFLLYFLIGSLVLINACEKEKSFEGGGSPSEGTLQDDGAGDCLPKTVAGIYVVGTALSTTNYIEVQVNVTTAGSYTIYTDTVNGIYFRGSGTFTTTGLITVRLNGNGTPSAAGIHNFIVSYGTSGCSIAVTTSGSLGTFTFAGAPGGCTGATPAGTYTVGINLTAANTVNITVNVTALGAYNISTAAANGMTFSSGAGVFTTLGTQAIVLTGSGTPVAAGPTSIPITAGSSSCSFTVNVQAPAGAATFTVNCATATVNGTYTVGTALTAANTITLPVNVTAIGTYTITATLNGMTFNASGTFATATPQNVTLAGTGAPTTAGANAVPVIGATTGCNITVNVNAAAGAATFTANCATATVNGTYTVGTALTAANTITLPVTVTAIGTYTITATLNGMTFNATGTFATATPQNVTLAGTGTPTTAGANVVPVTGATAGCNITVNVNAAAGAATFTANCATATVNGTYTVGTALTAANTITLPVNVTAVGTYTITATLNGMTFNASGTFATATPQNVTLAGTGTPTTPGANAVPVNGATAGCNITVNVNPGAGGPATYTVNCGSAIPNGTYTQGVALTAANTITLTVNATVAGTYTITTTATNGMTFSASGTLVLGANTVTLTPTAGSTPTADGTFSIPVTGGTTPCNFPLDVDPAVTSLGTWTFKDGATTFSGIITDAGMDATSFPPYLVFFMVGETTAGHYFELDLVDVVAPVVTGETYNCAVFTGAANTGVFYFEGPPPASAVLYEADPSIIPNTLVITVTSHNTATKTMTGTFSGNVKDGAGVTKAITNGAFTVTYP